MAQAIDRDYLFVENEWDNHFGNNAYHPEITKEIFSDKSHDDVDDAIEALGAAVRDGTYGYPEPEYANLYDNYLDGEDWLTLGRAVLFNHLEEDCITEQLWEWGEDSSEIHEIAGRAVVGNDSHYKVAHELGKHILDDIFDIYDVKGKEGVKDDYETVLPMSGKMQVKLEAIKQGQAKGMMGEIEFHNLAALRREVCDMLLELLKD